MPFLDQSILELAMNISPAEKMINLKTKPDGFHPKLEKYLLRKAFDDPEHPYLPAEVLWRQKEQFSECVVPHNLSFYSVLFFFYLISSHLPPPASQRRGLRLGGRAEGARGARGVRRRLCGAGHSFPLQPPRNQGVLSAALHLRGALPGPLRFSHRAVREIHRVLDARGGVVGPKGAQRSAQTKPCARAGPTHAAAAPLQWAASTGDISGRAVDVHDASGGFTLEKEAAKKAAGVPVAACLGGAAVRGGARWAPPPQTRARRAAAAPRRAAGRPSGVLTRAAAVPARMAFA